MNIHESTIKNVATSPARNEAERVYKQRYKTVPFKLWSRKIIKIVIKTPGPISKETCHISITDTKIDIKKYRFCSGNQTKPYKNVKIYLNLVDYLTMLFQLQRVHDVE
jgi:hypothetical protein